MPNGENSITALIINYLQTEIDRLLRHFVSLQLLQWRIKSAIMPHNQGVILMKGKGARPVERQAIP